MNKPKDDYYYRLGRHMAVIEFNDRIAKTQPSGINIGQMADWTRGYAEMAKAINWQRKSVKEQQVSNLKIEAVFTAG